MKENWITRAVKRRRENRAAARKAGMCGMCRKRRPRDGYKTCDVCLASVSKSQKIRANPQALELFEFCVDCQAYGRHRYGCLSQRQEMVRYG